MVSVPKKCVANGCNPRMQYFAEHYILSYDFECGGVHGIGITGSLSWRKGTGTSWYEDLGALNAKIGCTLCAIRGGAVCLIKEATGKADLSHRAEFVRGSWGLDAKIGCILFAIRDGVIVFTKAATGKEDRSHRATAGCNHLEASTKEVSSSLCLVCYISMLDKRNAPQTIFLVTGRNGVDVSVYLRGCVGFWRWPFILLGNVPPLSWTIGYCRVVVFPERVAHRPNYQHGQSKCRRVRRAEHARDHPFDARQFSISS